jgi:hypothetical protein
MDDRKGIKERLWEDVKTMAALFVYLAVFLGAFTTYKRQGNRASADWFDYCVGEHEEKASCRGLAIFGLLARRLNQWLRFSLVKFANTLKALPIPA